jgi:alanine racemase
MIPRGLDRLTWAEIHLPNFRENFRVVQKLIGPRVKIMAVVKANAYGHGAIFIAREAERLGASYLGVVCLREAREIRQAGIKTPILILNYIDGKGVFEAVRLKCTVTVMDRDILHEVGQIGKRLRRRVPIHIKIDTGMHRAGVLPGDVNDFITYVLRERYVTLEGIFTHFATSDETDLAFSQKQLDAFTTIVDQVKKRVSAPLIIHAANSGATLRLPPSHFDMVRPGIILYGLAPSQDFELPIPLKPVMALKTIVVQIRTIGKGETVGYGRTFTASGDVRVALLPIGYADGYRRSLGNVGYVLIRGKRAKILGRVSMDQTSVDVTNIPDVSIGDEVVLIGSQDTETISAEEVGEWIGTINYEVVSTIMARVPRIVTG